MKDVLTGAYGAAACRDLFAQPVKKDSCCICFDINNLADVNKECSQQAGDEMLKDFARYAERVLPEGAFFGRVKSDDFCVMLYDVDETNAKLFLSKLNDEIRIHNKYSNILGSFYGTILSYSYGYVICDTEANMNNEQLYYAAFYRMMEGKKHYKNKLNEQTRIVVVEDSFLSRNMMTDILKDLGYEALGVESGARLFEIIDDNIPDIVITGLNMPGIDGFGVMTRLQNEYHDVKIMVCSSISDDDTRKEAFEHGADEYISKPFDREMIKAAINRLKKM